ncbi:hypothetical protein [Domibacillus mangrovi]|uniref:Uncharacterized protein n=1 Tax=Domibacillus mangrovi TaxID=1714354 RepID=A0A1Q5NZZ9_9BACI|nr:hypothetical protein [Domibacillus mangrovi]OKL35585.1 hypothetical protein BLL40_14410 [Domibacillus mangrovi]
MSEEHCKHGEDKHRKNCERCKHEKREREDKDRMNQDDLKAFRYDEPRNMPLDRPLRTVLFEEENVLAKIKFCPKHDRKDKCSHDVVWLAATVGWRVVDPAPTTGLVLEFKIRKGSRNGDVIFVTRQGVGEDTNELNAQTTTFIHVDSLLKNKFTTCDGDNDKTRYYLTAEVIADEADDVALIVGPVVFTAAQIG